mgnify:CR=1 FL=1
MKNKKKYYGVSFILFCIAVLYTVLVKFVDVDSIGPNGSSVGFSTINHLVQEGIGTSDFWYQVTKYLGIIPFLLVSFYGIQWLMELIHFRKISKVNRKLLFLGGLYILLGITYIFFEKVIINYRPVLMDGELEASYPSSHTLLALTICLSSLLISKDYFKHELICKIIDGGTILLMILLVLGRILSGVHWISDIMGGVIISLFLVSLYYAFIKSIRITSHTKK